MVCIIEYSPANYYDHPIIVTPSIILTHEAWFRLVMDITIFWSYVLFKILIMNIKLEHYRIKISVTFLNWSCLVMKEKDSYGNK